MPLTCEQWTTPVSFTTRGWWFSLAPPCIHSNAVERLKKKLKKIIMTKHSSAYGVKLTRTCVYLALMFIQTIVKKVWNNTRRNLFKDAERKQFSVVASWRRFCRHKQNFPFGNSFRYGNRIKGDRNSTQKSKSRSLKFLLLAWSAYRWYLQSDVSFGNFHQSEQVQTPL